MVESEAHQLSEEKMLEAVVLGQESYKIVIDTIIELAKKAAKDPWAIPEEYQNLTLEQLKGKSTIQDTYEGLILAKDTAEEARKMTTVAKGEELKPNKDRFGELAYFESEVDDAIQRKDDPTVFDVWICIGEKIDRKDINNTCDDFLFLKYKDDRGPKIKTGDQVKFAGVFEGAKTKRIGSGAFRNENQIKTYP